MDSQCIDFPIDHKIYHFNNFPSFKQKIKNNPKILFYARPSQPRRLFDFGIQTLIRLNEINKEIKVTLYGEQIDINKIPKEFNSIGRITNQNKIAKLYREHSLGLVFSSTNPSLIPFEMLACGLPVFDVETGKKNVDLISCKSYISCEPIEEKIAKKLMRIFQIKN